MDNIRHARMMLGALREAAVVEAKLRRLAMIVRPPKLRVRPRGEIDMVEIAPGVFADPASVAAKLRRKRAPTGTLGRLHDAFERVLDAVDDDGGDDDV